MYGHLKGFNNVIKINSQVRDTFPTSSLYQNCEINSPHIYALEVTGEDTGILHWIDVSGDRALVSDLDFFKKVFCINTKEFEWYRLGSSYTYTDQILWYRR